MVREHERGVGEPHAPAGGLEQRRPGLALQHGELLRDGGRAVGQRLGDRADGPAAVQLVQEAEAAEVEHRSRSSHEIARKLPLFSISPAVTMPRMRGAFLCLASAAAFATLGIFGRLATDAGANVMTTLLVRFALAGAIFALILRFTGGWAKLRALPRRVVLTGLALGAAGYSLQSGLYFAAIGRLDVSMVSLLLYTYPAFVTVGAIALGRARPSLRTGGALAIALAGIALVLLAAGTGVVRRDRRAARARGVGHATRPTSSCPTA